MRLRIPPKVSYILDTLERHGFEAYAVGGCVRDAVLAREPHDWDITTSAKPEQVKRCFRRTIDTGILHGTVTVMLEADGFEVTTFRIDGAYSDGRHPDTVTFTPNLRDDLMRRDFTINAMAYNETRGLVDLYGGMQDLQKKIIRCVGDPDQRFEEDALRVMRAVRFAAQLGFRIEPATSEAVKRHASHLQAISAERIRDELVKLLASPHPEMLRTLYELGITAMVLPELDKCMQTPQNTPWHIYSVGEHIIHSVQGIEADPDLRMTMLLHDIAKPEVRNTDADGRDHFPGHAEASSVMADGILRRLKFDNATRRLVTGLIRWHMLRPGTDAADVRKCMVAVGPESFEKWLAVVWADTMAKSDKGREDKLRWINNMHARYRQILRNGDPLRIRDLAINGNDLAAIGISGKETGVILSESLAEVLKDPGRNRRDYLLEFARKQHAGR